jgi:hypothetical protein
LLSRHGGIVPAVRRRSERTLTLAEREEISRGIADGSPKPLLAGRALELQMSICKSNLPFSVDISPPG